MFILGIATPPGGAYHWKSDLNHKEHKGHKETTRISF